MKMTRAIGFVLCCLAGNLAMAHELRPAYLQLHQSDAEAYEVLWKVPGRGPEVRLNLEVEFPAQCTLLSPPRGSFVSGAFIARWSVKCAGGLAGGTIRVAGLAGTTTDVLVRLERLDDTTQVTRLTPAYPSFVVESSPDSWEIVRTYSALGVEHILTGVDHLLFVLALIIITRGGWRLVKTVTAFTLSHSVTLTAATLGFVHVPPRPVEAVIALSILFVAVEIRHGQRGRGGITARAPWLVALIFGLLHGLGFAGGLSAAGLPPKHIPAALLFFSLGVETGHLLFVGTVLAVLALARRVNVTPPRWARLVPPYAIGTISAFWLIDRSLAFFT